LYNIYLYYYYWISSRYGWCGTTREYCGYKCQTEYGRCNIDFNTEKKKVKNVVNTGAIKTLSGIDLLCKDSELSKKIIVYYPEWKYYDFTPKDIPFNKLTHVNYGKLGYLYIYIYKYWFFLYIFILIIINKFFNIII